MRFEVDLVLLEKRFYEISRVLHPDRFTGAAPQLKIASIERMSWINQAYRILKDPASRRATILESLGAAPASSSGPGRVPGARPSLPADLADSWFELNEALVDQAEQAESLVAAFERQLKAFRNEREAALKTREAALDALLEKGDAFASDNVLPIATEIAELAKFETYLRSLERELDSLKKRLSIR